MAEEDFHEIQLNGKQLVFLFMAGTVAAVVIFLSGLMVGRNLRVPRAEAAATTAETAVTDPTRPSDQVPPPPTAATESSTPVSTGETLTYATRLEAPTPAAEDIGRDDAARSAAKPGEKASAAAAKSPAPAPTTPAPADKAPAAKNAAAPKETAAPLGLNAEPPGTGWAVQVQAVKTRDQADAIARRLAAKGYPTFVTVRGAGYGVRVGKYDDKSEAEATKARLEKEEQLKPWVTR